MATEVIQKWTFGQTSLISANNSIAYWSRETSDPLYHPSSTGWKACLHGGLQTGDDWAALVIPVNEVPVPDFEAASWTYVMTSKQSMGANIVFWCHDPNNPIERAEITQDATYAGVTKASGRNAHVFDKSTTQMFYYGEITETPDTCPDGGTRYTWQQFQADSVFKTYTIYKITIEMGWEVSGTFDPVWIGDVVFNKKLIQLGPKDGKHRKTVKDYKTLLNTLKAAGDVFSDATTANGTRWSWSFGGTGYITKAYITHDGAVSNRVRLHLWDFPITDTEAEMDDTQAFNGPVEDGHNYYVGYIDFPALHVSGTGDAISLVVPGTGHTIPLEFSRSVLYGVTETLDEFTPEAALCNIYLTADMEDN